MKSDQEAVAKISKVYQKNWIKSSTFFHSLIAEQMGQVAHSYIHGGRHAKDIDVDITDVILCCLAYLTWLDKDADAAFKKSLEKHKRVIEAIKSRRR